MHRHVFLSLSVLLASLALPRQASPQSEYKLRADTTLVVIPVSVTDASNHFVLNLDKDRFSLFEDGVKQKISQFAGEDAPLSIGLLLDISGSIGKKLTISQSAIAEFLKTMSPQDEAFLVEFGDRAELALGFRKDPNAINEKLNSVESAGLTALIDAIHLGLTEMKKAKNPRKALLIISDGGENNSQYSSSDIQEIARQADVQIYCMGVFDPLTSRSLSPALLSGPDLLTQIANQTGGRVYPAHSLSSLPSIARKIGVELRNEYILAYSPSNSTRDGTFRKVKVTLDPPDGLSGLKARWRSGYYAPAQ